MMSKSAVVRCLPQIYRVLMFTYLREFRLAYGSEMEQVFRDRCRDVARTRKPMTMARFVLGSGMDWLTTSLRERVPPRGFVSE
jgi:hypothetical protein